MVNQTCVWSTYLCHSGPVAEVGSLLGTVENLTKLSENDKNVEFVNVTFFNTRYPKMPDDSENVLGRVQVLLKNNVLRHG